MTNIPELERHGNGNLTCNSWIITSKATGEAIFETFDRKLADLVNQDKYTVQTTAQYLGELNQSIAQ